MSLKYADIIHGRHQRLSRYIKETIITVDIINAMRYYEINDKELREQRDREVIYFIHGSGFIGRSTLTNAIPALFATSRRPPNPILAVSLVVMG